MGEPVRWDHVSRPNVRAVPQALQLYSEVSLDLPLDGSSSTLCLKGRRMTP